MSDMPNICNYVKNNTKTFTECPLNAVDSLVFSWLSYYSFPEEAKEAQGEEGVAIKDFYRADWLDDMCGLLFDPVQSRELLLSCAASPRFRDVRVSNYVQDTNQAASRQFSATTFKIKDDERYVGFRGTDNSLVGWKEDLNMSFATTVPSQRSAADYLDRVASASKGRIWCGGHSKGGNLAVYASVMSSDAVRDRVVCAFSHDGPGFPPEILQSERWLSSKVKIDKTIPQFSIFGMIFENQETSYRIVHSRAVGFSQHDPFSWIVEGYDFAKAPALGSSAMIFDESLNAYLSESNPRERERVIDAVFSVLEASGEETFLALKANWREALPKMWAVASALDPDIGPIVISIIGRLVGKMLPTKERFTDWVSRIVPPGWHGEPSKS